MDQKMKKKKIVGPERDAGKAAVDVTRPRIRAQRKFAQGQPVPISVPIVSVALKTATKKRPSTSSSPSTSAVDLERDKAKKENCPKAEDFLTFLCLRGTDILPKNLTHFDDPPEVAEPGTSDDESSVEQPKEKPTPSTPKRGGTVAPSVPGAVRKSASNTPLPKRPTQQKPLPPTVSALKKKYVEQRLARPPLSKALAPTANAKVTRAEANSLAGMRTRSSAKMKRMKQSMIGVPKTGLKVQSTNRKLSAATIIAKRKTRMATLTVSRAIMATRLRSGIGKKSRILRGRKVSISSDDEEDNPPPKDKTAKNNHGSNSSKKPSPPRRKVAVRKSSDTIERKGSDADEETSSRDSSRPPSQQKPTKHLNKKKESKSKSSTSDGSGEKPKKDNYGDSSTSSSESNQSRKKSVDSTERKKEYSVTPKKVGKSVDSPKGGSLIADTDDTKSDVDSEKSHMKKKANAKKDGEKKKQKNALKQLQDRLLEEAKKKMGSSNPNSPQSLATKASNSFNQKQDSDSDEKSCLNSQSKSSDQNSLVLDDTKSLSPVPVGSNGRRISKSSERTDTPPRKILPKTEPIERMSNSPHLPIGVVGAALTSSRLNSSPMTQPGSMKTLLQGNVQGMPMVSGATLQMPMLAHNMMAQNPNGNGLPLTQPLVINTTFPGCQLTNSQVTMSTPLQFATAQGGIIVSNTGMRMPITIPNVPMQVRPGGSVPIIMPPLALANGGILQHMQQQASMPHQHISQPSQTAVHVCAAMMRPSYPFVAQTNLISQPSMAQGYSQSPGNIPSGILAQNIGRSTNDGLSSSLPMLSPSPSIITSNVQHLRLQQQQLSEALSKRPGDLSVSSIARANSMDKGQNEGLTSNRGSASMMHRSLTVDSLPLHHLGPEQGIPILSPSDQSPTNKKGDPQPRSPYQQNQQLPKTFGYGTIRNIPAATAAFSDKIFPPTIIQNVNGQKTSLSLSDCSESRARETKGHTSNKGEKSKSILTKSLSGNPRDSCDMNSASFRVEDESSPYAFKSEPVEADRKLSFRGVPNLGNKNETKTVSLTPRAVKSSVSYDQMSPGIGNPIELPEELAVQIAEQAAADCSNAGTETTYFIPLSNEPGQSFGVAVKIGTEGPPGPNQKVIMKAKLVAQPDDKQIARKVFPAKTSAGNPSSCPQSSSSSHQLPSKSSAEKGFNAKSKSAKPAPVQKDSSSSSSDDSTDSSINSNSSSISMEGSRRKKSLKRKVANKVETKKDLKSTSGEKLASKPKQEDLPEPNASRVTSVQSCLGTIEALEKFPKLGQHAHLVEAPVFRPTESEFKDPMKYICKIRKEAEPFGICKIIPPASFKPECNVNDDMRFTAYNQYIHKLMNRWGQNSKEMAAITKYLDTQNVTIKPSNHPLVGGVEIDLPALYHAVQSFGGLTEVIQKKKWAKIADFLRIPKGTQGKTIDRGNKLDDIYCKFLLPYDTLSEVERNELLRLVEEEWEEKNKKKLEKLNSEVTAGNSDSEEEDEEDDEFGECVLKGKSTSLSQFFRVSRNLLSVVFKNGEPDISEVEEEFWRLVIERDVHMQVQQGSIDTGAGRGGEEYGFPTTRGSSCGRHPWNLKILSNNPKSLLRSMGPVMGVTVPTLNVGMLFSTSCWYRDPHGLPWVEYHHTGAPKLWYGVPESHGIAFYTAMKQLVPTFCRKKPIWMAPDTAMVPPNLLVRYNVSCCRVVQEQGQFMVVFPRAFSANICTGYSVSESVYFAPRDYLDFAELEFKSIVGSREPMMFPLSKLILCVAEDQHTSKATLKIIKPLLEKLRDVEYVQRTMISDLGVKNNERINLRQDKKNQVEDEYECEVCSANLYVSFLCDVKEDTYFCHDHAIEYLQKAKQSQRRACKLLFTHSKEEISSLIKGVNQRLQEADDSSSDSLDEGNPCRVSELHMYQQNAAQKSRQSGSEPSTSISPPFIPRSKPMTHLSKAKAESKEKERKDEEKRKEKELEKKEKVGSGKKKQSYRGSDSDSDSDSDGDDEPLKKKPLAKKEPSKSKVKSPPAKRGKKEKDKEPAKKQKMSESPSSLPARRTKMRKAALDRSGNLASEILDMLLSTSNESSDGEESGEKSSDESWK